jgi:PAS domain S-box
MTESTFTFDEEAADFCSSLDVGITIHDSETGSIHYANEYAEDIYGYSKEELNNSNIVDINPGSISQSEFIKRLRAAANGHSQQFEWRIRRPSGEIIWIEMRLSELSVNDHSYVIAAVRDISDHKMDLRYLRLMNRLVNHDFRNKVQIIQGSFNQMDAQTNDNIFNGIRRAIADLVDLTNWANAITSLNNGQNDKKINVRQLLTNTVKEYENKYPEINWEVDCENVFIMGNKSLQRAFDQLIDNAVRHNSHDDLDIIVSASENMADQQIDIKIIDTGEPIPDVEAQPLINGYDPDPLEDAEQIGLWEVQTIIDTHQGMLTLEENNPELKILKVSLPLADPQ